MHIIYFTFILSLCIAVFGYSDNKQRRFPDDFLFGAASSAYQIEGAWNEDGKGESIWDRYMHTNPEAADGAPGDTAADSYHLYKRDVEMLRELGVQFYRFSISWPRVLPTGHHNDVNEKGLQYYDNLIDELLKYNIQPMVVLYHFDLPQTLQELGGWASPLITDWFKEYARVIFDRYSSKVKYWITINQPNSVCISEFGEKPVPDTSRGVYEYICSKHVLMAHAKVYRMYEKEYKNKYKGLVGISISVNWADPKTNNTEDVQAAEDFREFSFGLYMNPIWSKTGDFPKIVKDKIAKKSKAQGYRKSRLPELTRDEVKLIKGSADFLGLNHYTTFLLSPGSAEHPAPSFSDDLGADVGFGPKWKQSRSAWLRSAPYGLYRACIYLNQKYDYPTMIVTENGWSTDPGLEDDDRVEYYREYLKALLLAMEDGTELRGFAAWSLMDNVEWMAGTSERFGLYEVDFDSAEKTRTARKSALVYKRIIRKRIVEADYTPKNLKIKITKKKDAKDEL